MEAATAGDLTQASEIAGRYITLGIPAKGHVSGLTVDRSGSKPLRLAKIDADPEDQ